MSENNNGYIDISKPIRFVGDFNTALDVYYGPYDSISICKEATQTQRDINGNPTLQIRYQGMTVGIKENGKIVEYWFKDGISDDDLIKKIDTDKIKDELSNDLLPKYNELDNSIEWPNIGNNIKIYGLKESSSTLTLDSFVGIKKQLFGDGVAVTTISAQVDKNSKLQGVLSKFSEDGLLKPDYVGGLVAVQESSNNAINIAKAAANRASVSDDAASAACGMVGDNPTPYTTDGSLNDLINIISKIDAIPEAAVLSSIRSNTTYYFVRLISYEDKEANTLTQDEINFSIKEINNKLKSDSSGINYYIYMVEDAKVIEKFKDKITKPTTNIPTTVYKDVNKQFSLYYETSTGEVRQLQFKKTFNTLTDYNNFVGNEIGVDSNNQETTASNKNPFEIIATSNNGHIKYFRNDTDDSGLTESTLKVYSTTYKWSLLTNFYNADGTEYKQIFTNDSTGDGIADLNEEICNVEQVDDGRNTPYFEYFLEDEYTDENGSDENPTPLYTTLKYLTNGGERNTKYIYLLCFKDGKFDGKDSEYGFYFRPYIWYQDKVQRLNSTITMGYSFTGKSWDYTDPISTYNGIDIKSAEDIDNLLNEIVTTTNTKIIVEGQTALPEINDITFGNINIGKVEINKIDGIIKQTYESLKSKFTGEANYSDTSNEYYQLANYFSYSDIYYNLEREEKHYIDLIDEIMFASRFGLNDKNYIEYITIALTATLMKIGIKNSQEENILKDFDDCTKTNPEYIDNLETLFKEINITDKFAWETLYYVVYDVINNNNLTNDKTHSKIGEIILNIFKINSYILDNFSVSSVVAYIIFVNCINIINGSINILSNMTSQNMNDDPTHIVYKALAKLKLQNGINFDLSSLNELSKDKNNYLMNSNDLYENKKENCGGYIVNAYNSNNPLNPIQTSNEDNYESYMLNDIYSNKGVNFIMGVERQDSRPEVKEVKETTYLTSMTPKEKGKGNPQLPDDWYKTNTVVVFLIDSETVDNHTTNTFEYRKWNKCTKTWVDYGMEIITIENNENNWTLWKPRPSLDLNLTNLRVSQRNILKNNQNQYQTRLAISTDVTNLTNVLSTANVSQANTNATLVDMINTLTATINKMNEADSTKSLIKGLSLNNDGIVVKSEEVKVISFETGKLITAPTSSSVISSVSETVAKSTVNISTENLVSNNISTTPATKITTIVKLK